MSVFILILVGLLRALPAHGDLTAGDVSAPSAASPDDVRALQSSFDQFYQAQADGNTESAARFRDQIRRQMNSLQAKKVGLKFDNRKLTDSEFSKKLLALQASAPGSSQVAGSSFLRKTINMCVVLANLACGVMTGDYDHPDLEPIEPQLVRSREVAH